MREVLERFAGCQSSSVSFSIPRLDVRPTVTWLASGDTLVVLRNQSTTAG
jgi:hypothetical protein